MKEEKNRMPFGIRFFSLLIFAVQIVQSDLCKGGRGIFNDGRLHGEGALRRLTKMTNIQDRGHLLNVLPKPFSNKFPIVFVQSIDGTQWFFKNSGCSLR